MTIQSSDMGRQRTDGQCICQDLLGDSRREVGDLICCSIGWRVCCVLVLLYSVPEECKLCFYYFVPD